MAETVGLVRRELDGSGVALIGFAGAPFTVASYAVEGGPSRTFAKVKALMHGDPDLWQQLTGRLAAMAVASLRAQIEAGAQAVQLFDSWAGSLSPDEYARFALPSTRAVLEGIADLDVPTILFGVGTGELLALMGSAGSDVVGVDWRVPLDEARRRVGPGHAAAGQPRPRALPGAVAGGRADASRECWPRRGGRQRHRTRLQPGPRRAARDGPGHPARGGRAGARGDAHGHDDRRAAHGARHAGEHGGDRPLLHAHPPGPPTRRPSNWPSSKAATPPSAGVSPLTVRTAAQVDAVVPALEARAPGRYMVSFGAKHTEPLIEEAAAALAAAGLERVIGLVLTPHGSSMGSQEYLERAAAALGADALRGRRPLVRRAALVALLAARVQRGTGRTAPGRRHVVFSAHSLPERIREAGDTYPEQLAESARLVAEAAGLDELAGGVAERRAHARAVARPRRARRGAPAGRGEARRHVVVCPIGFVADHLEVLYDLDIEWPPWRRRRARLHPHGIAQRRPRVHRHAGRVIIAADGGRG